MDLRPQFRNLVLKHVPDEVQVDAKVVVNQAIAHARHRAPLHLGMSSTQVR